LPGAACKPASGRLPGCDAERRHRPAGDLGISLIELLVALAIVATMAGAVLLAFPDMAGRTVETSAGRVQELIVLACERAERSGRDFGIAIGNDSLRFGPFVDGVWQPLADSPSEALRPRQLPEPLTLALSVDGAELALADGSPDTPQLACLATGERTPFELALVDGHGTRVWQIQAAVTGAITGDSTDAR
jgi:type II secretory pathway pseudopilin PulG